MSEQFILATANTFAGHLIKDSKGLEPFRRAQTDVLLLQEVLHLKSELLDAYLGNEGYNLVNFDKGSGLAIAVRQASKLLVDKGSDRVHSLRSPGALGQFAIKREMPTAHRFRTRAMISVDLLTEDNIPLCVMTTHPIVFARRMARNKQLRKLGGILSTEYADRLNLLLGGDMNHYPGPSRADEALAEGAGLTRVPIIEPTWKISGSRHEWMAVLAASRTYLPLEAYDGYLDSILYRGPDITLEEAVIQPIQSDHDAIISYFRLGRAATSLSGEDQESY